MRVKKNGKRDEVGIVTLFIVLECQQSPRSDSRKDGQPNPKTLDAHVN